jgi:hypothetical protein
MHERKAHHPCLLVAELRSSIWTKTMYKFAEHNSRKFTFNTTLKISSQYWICLLCIGLCGVSASFAVDTGRSHCIPPDAMPSHPSVSRYPPSAIQITIAARHRQADSPWLVLGSTRGWFADAGAGELACACAGGGTLFAVGRFAC